MSARPQEEQSVTAGKKGVVISVFKVAEENPDKDRPGILAVSRASGDGYTLLNYLRRISTSRKKPNAPDKWEPVSLNGGLFKVMNGKPLMKVFIPDGFMQAVNFVDVAKFETCWHLGTSIDDFKDLTINMSTQGLKESTEWSSQLQEEFFAAVLQEFKDSYIGSRKKAAAGAKQSIPGDSDLEAEYVAKQQTKDKAQVEQLKELYIVTFDKVMNDAVFTEMAIAFTAKKSPLRQGIMETISNRREKMAHKAGLEVTAEQLKYFTEFFESEKNDGKTAALCEKLKEFGVDASDESIRKFVGLFLQSCYYLVYEAVAVDWLKKNASTLYYPGAAVTPMLKAAMLMEPPRDPDIFWRDLSVGLLPADLMQGVRLSVNELNVGVDITADQKAAVLHDCEVAEAIIAAYKVAPKKGGGQVLIQDFLPADFSGKHIKDAGAVYKLHRELVATYDKYKLESKPEAEHDSLRNVVTPPPAAQAPPESPCALVARGAMRPEDAIELMQVRTRLEAVKVLSAMIAAGFCPSEATIALLMLGNGNQREPLGFVVSPPSFGGLKIGARARARTRSVSSSGTRESSGLFKHAPGVLPDPALGSGDRSKISPAGTQ